MNCKIVSVYFGNRLTYPSNQDSSIITLKNLIKNEISLNPGVNQLDTILVNHNCNNKEGNTYLDSLEGLKTYSGKIKVIHRPWNKGIGMSFASFNYAFEKFRNDYDYWFFQEDDYKLIYENYYSEGINIMNKKPNLSFLGYDRQSPQWKNIFHTIKNNIKLENKFNQWENWEKEYVEFTTYFNKLKNDIKKNNKKYYFCDGGMGLTHKKFLDKIYKLNNTLPYCKSIQPKEYDNTLMSKVWWLFNVVLGEIKFTNIHTHYGYELDVFPSDTPIIYSYKSNKNR
jgi:hypothetical protein